MARAQNEPGSFLSISTQSLRMCFFFQFFKACFQFDQLHPQFLKTLHWRHFNMVLNQKAPGNASANSPAYACEQINNSCHCHYPEIYQDLINQLKFKRHRQVQQRHESVRGLCHLIGLLSFPQTSLSPCPLSMSPSLPLALSLFLKEQQPLLIHCGGAHKERPLFARTQLIFTLKGTNTGELLGDFQMYLFLWSLIYLFTACFRSKVVDISQYLYSKTEQNNWIEQNRNIITGGVIELWILFDSSNNFSHYPPSKVSVQNIHMSEVTLFINPMIFHLNVMQTALLGLILYNGRNNLHTDDLLIYFKNAHVFCLNVYWEKY